MKQLKYALFTGCTAKQSTPEQMMSTMAVARKLGIEMIELTEASCCGASHLQDYDDFLSLVLNCQKHSLCRKTWFNYGHHLQHLSAKHSYDKT